MWTDHSSTMRLLSNFRFQHSSAQRWVWWLSLPQDWWQTNLPLWQWIHYWNRSSYLLPQGRRRTSSPQHWREWIIYVYFWSVWKEGSSSSELKTFCILKSVIAKTIVLAHYLYPAYVKGEHQSPFVLWSGLTDPVQTMYLSSALIPNWKNPQSGKQICDDYEWGTQHADLNHCREH